MNFPFSAENGREGWILPYFKRIPGGRRSMTIYHILYILTAFVAIFVQAKSRSYQDLLPHLGEEQLLIQTDLDRLLIIRRFMSPFIAGLTALLILIASLCQGTLDQFVPRLFIPVWLLASSGDVFIEGAYSIRDKSRQQIYYLIGMFLFMAMTVLLGSGLIVYALKTPLPALAHPVSILIPAALGVGAFFTLRLDKGTLGPMIIYDLSVSVLLCGGLYSLFAGHYALAFIGIGYFVSDWMVGLRDFGKRKSRFLEQWVLLIILMLYYTIMLLSLDTVLRLS